MATINTNNSDIPRLNPASVVEVSVPGLKSPSISSGKKRKSTSYTLYITSSASLAIENYGLRKKLSPDEIHDIKVFAGVVYEFTQLAYKDEARIGRSIFRAVFRQSHYKPILNHAIESVVGFEKCIPKEKKATYWIKKRYLDDEPLVEVISDHPIPNYRIQYSEDSGTRFNDRIMMADQFIDQVYIPELRRIDYENWVVNRSKSLIDEHSGNTSMAIEEKFNHRKAHNNLIKFKRSIAGGLRSNSCKDGRVYNILTAIKRELRIPAGTDIIEEDMSNSHPHILGCILKDIFIGRRYEQGKHYYINKLKETKNNEPFSNAALVLEIIEFLKGFKNYGSVAVNNMNIDLVIINRINKLDYIKFENNNKIYNTINNNINYITISGYKSELNEEINTLLKYTSIGELYDFVINSIDNSVPHFLPYLFVIKPELSNNEWIRLNQDPDLIDFSYKKRIVKILVMKWINGDYVHYVNKRPVENPIFSIMMTIFPYITTLLYLVKSKNEFGKTGIHGLLAIAESEFVFTVVEKCSRKIKRQFPVGTIHDSFLIRPGKLNTLKREIKTVFKLMFGESVHTKSKTT